MLNFAAALLLSHAALSAHAVHPPHAEARSQERAPGYQTARAPHAQHALHAKDRHDPRPAGQANAHRGAPAKVGQVRRAKPAAPAPAEEVEQVEDVEAVEAVEAPAVSGADAGDANAQAGAAGSAKLSTNDLLGHLHAAVVHLPIAWLALWSFFEALAIVWRHPWLVMAGLPMSVVTTLSFAPAVLTGISRMDELHAASSSYDAAPALLHRNLLFAAWALVVLACGLRLTAARPQRTLAARVVYVLLVWTAFAITGWSAHLGGCMVYGDDFLPF